MSRELTQMFSQLNKKDFKIANLSSSFFLLVSDIEDGVVKEAMQWIIESNFSDNRPSVLNLLVCSSGGDLRGAFALIDIMRSSHIPIRTIGLGEISSAGLMIFLAGASGMRVLTPNTSIMSHQFSAGALGKEHELFSIAKEFELTKKRMLSLYKKSTGLKEKDILTYLLPPSDMYLSAEEALALNICDKIANLS
jgi:ATP-dependent Clp protease protease subunit